MVVVAVGVAVGVGVVVNAHKDRELTYLRLLAKVTADTRYDTECAVRRARDQGATWAEVGAALGVTQQAAHERFRRLADPPQGQP